jgi:hypothetical protein
MSVTDDLLENTSERGFVYDVKSGGLTEVQ